MGTLLALLVAVSVFMHGQLPAGHKYKRAVRAASTVTVTAAVTYASWCSDPIWYFALAAAVSTASAFMWGPEIGRNREVLRTQAFKGLWLAAPLFPFGLLYAVLRPLAYWIGYTKFTGQKWPDMVARALSGIFLAAVLTAALHAARVELLAVRLDGTVRAVSSFSRPDFTADQVKFLDKVRGAYAA